MTEPVASLKQKSVHEELAHHLKAMLLPTNADQLVIGKFMKHSWFFFELLVKSMAQHLLSTGRIKVSVHAQRILSLSLSLSLSHTHTHTHTHSHTYAFATLHLNYSHAPMRQGRLENIFRLIIEMFLVFGSDGSKRAFPVELPAAHPKHDPDPCVARASEISGSPVAG